MLRENTQTFQLFMAMIERENNIPDKLLDNLADDLIFLLFADFTSSEKNIITILRHFEGLIQVFIYYLKLICRAFSMGIPKVNILFYSSKT